MRRPSRPSPRPCSWPPDHGCRIRLLITAFVNPIKEFGVLTAIGVMLAMGLSLSLIPAILILVKPPKVRVSKDKTKKDGPLTRILQTLVHWAVSRSKLLVAAVTVICGVRPWCRPGTLKA